MLAEGYRNAGRTMEGLDTIAEAYNMLEKNNERLGEAELYRLQGELLLAQGEQGQKIKGKRQKVKMKDSNRAEAETCFLKALEVARRQQAKSFELRAAMSLSHLWQQQGRREDARHLLGGVYEWFTEGSDTLDLQEAKNLLDQLS